ncbi:hypothetical protein COT94_01010 [Candidatus Falkowbacteria bacterium CG10_big_fil_rev_8_21_14_0_10_37_14]|uniref:Septum formation initiator n=1 Tax=Candidatus Falkowbacteria bacterium CG10_big_fil_rev_8_21_14_0_10_37_14 TaxID=1974561 RepID=A0A2M6WU00_9BACT|nr:MAG: hypothetical protein COT94_01010 [Candidatus Falkowbacteria bacterium CG10_big_fil_rev_8_21_14_0_10_37_14]
MYLIAKLQNLHYNKKMFKKKKETTWLPKSRLAVTILALAILVLLLPNWWRTREKQSQIDREVALMKADIQVNEGNNSQLKQMLAYLESPEFLEEQARIKFNLKKDGEKVVVVKDSEVISDILSQDQVGVDEKNILPGNYQKWLDYFFEPKG